MGVGIIIRDEKGNVIAATSKPVMATHDPATAEALAALRVVGFCREVGAFDINLEGGTCWSWIRPTHLFGEEIWR
jgi:hypothetical protein